MSHAPRAARAELCRFLAGCYYEPGAHLGEESVFESMQGAAGHIDAELAAEAGRLGAAYAEEGLQDLLVDYTRLFLAPGANAAKPYASVWLEEGGGPPGPVSVVDLYAAAGFEVAGDFADLPDHIAAELEFLYLLIFHGRGDLERRFVAGHLGPWVRPFAHAVERYAQSRFYRDLARLTRRFVELEAQRPAPA